MKQSERSSRPSPADVAVALLFTSNPVRTFLSLAIFLTAASIFVNRAIATRFFGAFTIVTYPYYHELVGDIVREPAFVRRLGDPIVVDDAGVWCQSIAVASSASTSQCWLPVRGPHGPANVFERATFSGGRLSADLTLHAGDNMVHAAVAP